MEEDLIIPEIPQLIAPSAPQGEPTPTQKVKEFTHDELVNDLSSKLKVSPVKNPYAADTIRRSEELEPYIKEELSFNKNTIDSGNLQGTAYQSQNYWDRLGNDLKISGANFTSTFIGGVLEIPQIIENTFGDDKEFEILNPLAEWRNDVQANNTSFRTPGDETQGIGGYLIPSFITGNTDTIWGSALQSAGFGLGGVASTIVVEAALTFATGGLADLPYLGKKIFDAAKYITSLGKLEKIREGLAASKSAYTLLRNSQAVNVFANVSKTALRSAYGSYVESAFEAIDGKDKITKELLAEYVMSNGKEATGDDLEKINQTAQDASNTRFWANYIGLTLTNMPFTKSMYAPFDKALNLNQKFEHLGVKLVNGKLEKTGLKLSGDFWEKNALRKGLKSGIEFGANTLNKIELAEGLEEGYQFALEKGTENVFTSAYDPKANETFSQSLLQGFRSLGSGAQESMSEEGLKNVLSGIAGGVFQIGAAKGLYHSIKKTKYKQLNDEDGTYHKWEVDAQGNAVKKAISFKDYIENQVVGVGEEAKDLVKRTMDPSTFKGTLGEQLESYKNQTASSIAMLESKDKLLHRELQDAARFQSILPYVSKGYKGILIDKIKEEVQGNDEIKNKQEVIGELTQHVETVAKYSDRMEETFKNPYNPKKAEEIAMYQTYEDLKKVGTYHLFMLDQHQKNKDALSSFYGDSLFSNDKIRKIIDHFFTEDKSTKALEKESILGIFDTEISQINSDLAMAAKGTAVLNTADANERKSKLLEVRKEVNKLLDKRRKDSDFKDNANKALDRIYELETGQKLLQPGKAGWDNYDEIFNNMYYVDDLNSKINKNLEIVKDLQGDKLTTDKGKQEWIGRYKGIGAQLAMTKEDFRSQMVKKEATMKAMQEIMSSDLTKEGKTAAIDTLLQRINNSKDTVIGKKTAEEIIAEKSVADKLAKEAKEAKDKQEAEEKLREEEELKALITDLATRIVDGENITSTADLQLQATYPKRVESEIARIKDIRDNKFSKEIRDLIDQGDVTIVKQEDEYGDIEDHFQYTNYPQLFLLEKEDEFLAYVKEKRAETVEKDMATFIETLKNSGQLKYVDEETGLDCKL